MKIRYSLKKVTRRSGLVTYHIVQEERYGPHIGRTEIGDAYYTKFFATLKVKRMNREAMRDEVDRIQSQIESVEYLEGIGGA